MTTPAPTTSDLDDVVRIAEKAGLDAVPCREGVLLTSVLVGSKAGTYRVRPTSDGLRVLVADGEGIEHTVKTAPSPVQAIGAVLDHTAGVPA